MWILNSVTNKNIQFNSIRTFATLRVCAKSASRTDDNNTLAIKAMKNVLVCPVSCCVRKPFAALQLASLSWCTHFLASLSWCTHTRIEYLTYSFIFCNHNLNNSLSFIHVLLLKITIIEVRRKQCVSFNLGNCARIHLTPQEYTFLLWIIWFVSSIFFVFIFRSSFTIYWFCGLYPSFETFREHNIILFTTKMVGDGLDYKKPSNWICFWCRRQEGQFKVLCIFWQDHLSSPTSIQWRVFSNFVMLSFVLLCRFTHEYIHLTLTTFSAYNPHYLIRFLWLPRIKSISNIRNNAQVLATKD